MGRLYTGRRLLVPWLLCLLLFCVSQSSHGQDSTTPKPPLKKTSDKPGTKKTEPKKSGTKTGKKASAKKEPMYARPNMKVFLGEKKRMELIGAICRQRSKQLEVLICTRRGKTHESLLKTQANPIEINTGLLLMGLKPTPQVKKFGQLGPLPLGDKVVIEVEWCDGVKLIRCKDCFHDRCKKHKDPLKCEFCKKVDKVGDGAWCKNCQIGYRWERIETCERCWFRRCDGHFMRECVDCKNFDQGKVKTHCRAAVEHGDLVCHQCHMMRIKGKGWCNLCQWGYKGGKKRRVRVERLIFDKRRGDTMEMVGFVYTGSRHKMVPKPPNFNQQKVFASAHSGNIGVIYHDPDAILDTPLAAGGDDEAFVPFEESLPTRNTPVRIHIRAWTKADQAILDGVKKDVKKDAKSDAKSDAKDGAKDGAKPEPSDKKAEKPNKEAKPGE